MRDTGGTEISRDDRKCEMPEASKPNIHGYIHGKWQIGQATPEVLKKIR